MKKITIALFSLVALSASAQIPNSGFENWNTPAGTTYEEPDSWSTSNAPVTGIGASANVLKVTGTQAYMSGTTPKMQTVDILAGFAQATGALVSGTITYASTPSPTFIFGGGFPFTSRPGGLTGSYNYSPGTGDSARFAVILTKWNTSTSGRDTIANGLWHPNYATGAYLPFNVPLNYNGSTANPDTALIIFLSSTGIISGNTSSVLYVDNLSFQFSAGINDIKAEQINTYPNPATDRLMIDMIPGQYSNASIYDMTGRLINKLDVVGNSIDVSALNNGQYILELRNNKGAARSTFSKQ